jgi:hypothetical protein
MSLSSSGPHQVDAFRNRISPFQGLWRSLDVRYSAVSYSGIWYNLISEVLLTSAAPDPSLDETFVELPSFKSGRFSWNIDRLDGILESIKSQHFDLGDLHLRLATPNRTGQGQIQDSPESAFFSVASVNEGWKPFWRPGVDSVAFTLGSWSGSTQELLGVEARRELDRQLLIHAPPYFGLDDLAQYFLRAVLPLQYQARFYVTAPLETRIQEVVLDADNRISLSIIAPPTALKRDLRVVARTLANDRVTRLDIHPTESGEESVGSDIIRLSVDSTGFEWVGGALILKQEKVDEFTFVLPSVNQPNPRLASLDVTDQGPRRLEEYLGGDLAVGRPEESHEIGSAWLLSIAGFQVISSGLRSLSMGSAPDAFAFVPFSNSVLVVEATTADLATDGKLVKLFDRAEALRRILPGFEVLPVAMTRKSQLTPVESGAARELGVRVLGPEEFAEMRERARRNDPPARTFEYIKSKLPQTNPFT